MKIAPFNNVRHAIERIAGHEQLDAERQKVFEAHGALAQSRTDHANEVSQIHRRHSEDIQRLNAQLRESQDRETDLARQITILVLAIKQLASQGEYFEAHNKELQSIISDLNHPQTHQGAESNES